MTAAAIIDSAHEDQLAIEDLLLFFDGAMKNQYGRVLDHLDQHVVFEMFEKYRHERHMAYMNIRDEQEAQYKAGGDANRISESGDNHLKDVAFVAELAKYNHAAKVAGK